VHHIPRARVYAKRPDLIHLEESMSWKAEPSEHLVPLRPAARVSRGGATAEAGTERMHAYPAGPRWRSPKIICSDVVAFLDGREPNTSPPRGRLEEASTACELNRIRGA
jgi:hypothetical protein